MKGTETKRYRKGKRRCKKYKKTKKEKREFWSR